MEALVSQPGEQHAVRAELHNIAQTLPQNRDAGKPDPRREEQPSDSQKHQDDREYQIRYGEFPAY